ncbi:putative 2OG-Fe(II) oxygenase [Sandaracinobacter sp. RS1-74]|uniref:putative 2OG-Fe(II) oxygenase n=1 Tax=Sandaracinobacteroides sayramensis TaxID=2913411 RepID=UPI001EDA6DD4|nr:putative 2OG-Fe(II) oxygenase [Sandaracinobacteroides sayramensis]MCG2842650.1 putative 2OG-Fe(II) oxygenase [Sandaracinobacteroides sayramensis]
MSGIVTTIVTMDINSLFSRAEQAFVAKNYEAARADLSILLVKVRDHPTLLQLAALVEKACGNFQQARLYFERALLLSPTDPQLLTNHANLLHANGEKEAALAGYKRALALKPDFSPAQTAYVSLLRETGRWEDALTELGEMLSAQPESPALHITHGATLLDLGRPAEAALAFDRALALAPDRPAALHGRARAALLLCEEEAVAHYARVRAFLPNDPDIILGDAQARAQAGDPHALDALEHAVAARPDWIEGHRELALMRFEAGHQDNFAAHFAHSIAKRPDDMALFQAWWLTLYRGNRHEEAREVAQRMLDRFGDKDEANVPLALSMVDTRTPEQALHLLGPSPESPQARLALGRAALAAMEPEFAASALEAIVTSQPENIGAWALLDLAWRILDDPRHQWLSGRPHLYGTTDIDLGADELVALAERLRGLHRSRSHPIGQSLRGGTQTRGRLFDRDEPILNRLFEALTAAVERHRAALPPEDQTHPLLRYRNAGLSIGGAWSVRLSGSGFHVSHIHPEGILSSACYVALPPGFGSTADKEGWLELGRPPSELGLDLQPLATIEPSVGRLALFPSYLFHGTRPFREGERLTVAFDIACAKA